MRHTRTLSHTEYLKYCSKLKEGKSLSGRIGEEEKRIREGGAAGTGERSEMIK